MPTDIERLWVRRAHAMLRNVEHVRERNLVNLYCRWPGLEDAGLSWPGYLGDDVVPGRGVLAIANVHRDFRSDGLSLDPEGVVQRLVAGTKALKEHRLDGLTDGRVDAYLTAVRPAYLRGLGSHGWNVGRNLRPVYQAFHLDDEVNLRRLTFVNVSCGQFPEGAFESPWTIDKAASRAAKTKMATRCSRTNAHPVETVVDLVQPEVILCMSAKAWQRLREYRDRFTIVYVHQWRGRKLLGPVTLDGCRLEKGADDSEWLPCLSRHIERRTTLQ